MCLLMSPSEVTKFWCVMVICCPPLLPARPSVPRKGHTGKAIGKSRCTEIGPKSSSTTARNNDTAMVVLFPAKKLPSVSPFKCLRESLGVSGSWALVTNNRWHPQELRPCGQKPYTTLPAKKAFPETLLRKGAPENGSNSKHTDCHCSLVALRTNNHVYYAVTVYFL